jgi:hypothetical protein
MRVPIVSAVTVVLELVQATSPRRDHWLPRAPVESVEFVSENQFTFGTHRPLRLNALAYE